MLTMQSEEKLETTQKLSCDAFERLFVYNIYTYRTRTRTKFNYMFKYEDLGFLDSIKDFGVTRKIGQ